MAVMSEIRRRRLVNPGRRRKRNASKRKLSPLQKLFFGSKRQRAAVKANRGRKRRRRVNAGKRSVRKTLKRVSKAYPKAVGSTGKAALRKFYRRKNVGSIVTVLPSNPGRKRRKVRKVNTMAKRRTRKRNVVYRRRVKRGVYQYSNNPGRRRRRRRSNPGVRHYRRRRRNPSMRRVHRRRRNPGMLTGTVGSVVGILAGLTVTKFACGFIPAQFSTGVMGYVATAAVAVAQGKLIGKVAKNAQLGHNMMVGGLAYLTARILSDFFPSIGGYTGISGMGLIGGSQFYVPQVNQQGSMGSFVPVGTPMIAPAANGGKLGTLRRTGRMM